MRARAIIVVVLLMVFGGLFLTGIAESHVRYPENRIGVRSQNFTPDFEKAAPQNPEYISLEQFLSDGFTSSTLVIQKELDSTHLAYFGARYYDPTSGRFTTPDPFMGHLTDPRSQFMYGYGFNNPNRFTDPFGQFVIKEDYTHFFPQSNNVNLKQDANRLSPYDDLGTPASMTIKGVFAFAEGDIDINNHEKLVLDIIKKYPGIGLLMDNVRLKMAFEKGFPEIGPNSILEITPLIGALYAASSNRASNEGPVIKPVMDWLGKNTDTIMAANLPEKIKLGIGLGNEFTKALLEVFLQPVEHGAMFAGDPTAPTNQRVLGAGEVALAGVNLYAAATASTSVATTKFSPKAKTVTIDTTSSETTVTPWGTRDVATGKFTVGPRGGIDPVDDFIAHAKANGFEVLGKEISFRTPFETRRVDVVIRNPKTGKIGAIEIKSSLGEFNKFKPEQSAADWYINEFGAPAVGQNAAQANIRNIDYSITILWEVQ